MKSKRMPAVVIVVVSLAVSVLAVFGGRDIDKAAQSGAPTPSGLTADERVAYERLTFVYAKGVAYGYQLALRPQTMTALANSPVGLAAYLLDHDERSLAHISELFVDGRPFGDLTRTSAELGGAGVSEAYPLQQARPRRTLRGLGTADTPSARGSRGLPITA